MKLPVKFVHDTPRMVPDRGSDHAAGLDLYAATSAHLPPGARCVVGTNIAVAIPEGHVGLVWPRSGLAVRHGIDVLAGVIDSDFAGEVGVVLINHGQEGYIVNEGDRIAQLLIQPVVMATPVLVDELPETARGTGGYGSTGV